MIRDLLCHAVFSNLFCVHPPYYFQIDGNLGFIAGINEMLVTEENGMIELLPALPELYGSEGEVREMVVNGAKISFKWKNGLVTELSSDLPVCVCAEHIAESAKISENIEIL